MESNSTLARLNQLFSNRGLMPVSFIVRVCFWLWLGAAMAVGHFLVLQRVPAVAVQGTTLVLTSLVLLVCLRVTPVRRWVDSLDLRVLVLIHVIRLIGVYLLMLCQRGELPRAFAVSAGIIDIIVATMALPVALAPIEAEPRRRAMAIWNVVGFVGLVVATFNAARINLADPSQLRSFTHLPLSLLPTFVVPVLLATHVIIFTRTSRSQTNG